MRAALAFVVLVWLAVVASADATFRFPTFFSDNMVFQRHVPVNVWGWAPASAAVTVVFDNEKYVTTADASGSWVVQLAAHDVSSESYELIAQSGSSSLSLKNIIFGDLYICSGQSNMQFSVSEVFNASQEIANSSYPEIRFVTIARNPSLTAEADAQTVSGGWRVTGPSTVNGGDWQFLSATCYFFARDTFLGAGVPIGLVESDYGGTIIEAWSSADVLKKCGESALTTAPVRQAQAMTPAGNGVDPNTKMALWNGMVNPLRNFFFTGALWYQGEANAGNPKGYECLFPAMIADWRAKMQNPHMFFYFVQLSTWYEDGEHLPAIRLAQEAGLTQPQTGMATAMDLSDYASPYNCIHPRNKQEVGRRLSLHALHDIYGKDVPFMSPRYVAHKVNTSSPATLFDAQVTFSNAYAGLAWNASVPHAGMTGFELSQDGTNWTQTGAWIVGGNTVRVQQETHDWRAIKFMRYAWTDWPICSVYNSASLPALQFLVSV